MVTWLVAILFVGTLVLGAALWDEWREHQQWTHAGLGDDPAHTDACHICARRTAAETATEPGGGVPPASPQSAAGGTTP